jgi:hypothetical protein
MSRALALVLLGITSTAQAQARWNVSFGAGGGPEIAHSRVGTTRERVSGLVLAGEGVATRGRFVARLRYGQGRVTNDTAGRDVAEGEALLGYKARPWLTVWFGPHARTFVVPGQSDRRWLFWSGRVAARGSLLPGRVESYVELWQGVTGRLSRPAESASGSGGEAGLDLRLARHPIWGRLGYRIEQGRASGGARRETVEAITLTVGYGY